MGTVYLAFDTQRESNVAVKVLSATALQSKVARLRLQREIEILSTLHSPYIAEMYTTGTMPDNSPYLVMEYLEGRDLKAELRERGPLPVAEAVGYLIQACRGISVAHAAHILHRDLKPHNLFLTHLDGNRVLKVLDFGVAKVLDAASDLNLTTTDTIIGTPLYLCPEQLLDSKDITLKADIWALGVILYEMLVGFAPFTDDSPGAVIAAITLDEQVPIRQLRGEVPEGLQDVIEAALAKVPCERIPSVDELERLLLPYSAAPDQLFVPVTDGHKPLYFDVPERKHGELDLRNYIKKTVDAAHARGRDTVPSAPRSDAPAVEQLALVPSLSRISTRIATSKAAQQRADSNPLAVPDSRLPVIPLARRATGGRAILSVALAALLATAGVISWRKFQPRPSISSPFQPAHLALVSNIQSGNEALPPTTSRLPAVSPVATNAAAVTESKPRTRAAPTPHSSPPNQGNPLGTGSTKIREGTERKGIPLNL